MNHQEIEKGTVKSFDAFKGFGFISRDKGKDVFVFYLDIVDKDKTLVEGDTVEFNVISSGKGPKAENVKKVS